MAVSKFLKLENMNLFNMSKVKKEIFYYYVIFYILMSLINVFVSTIISLKYFGYLLSGFTSIVFVGQYLKGVKPTDYKTDIFVIFYGLLLFLVLDNIILVDLILLSTFGILKLNFKKKSRWKLYI
jgi:hypothetical protein